VKPAEILCSLNAQNPEEILSCASVSDWYNNSFEGCKEILNLLHAHVQPTALCNVNICCIKELILRKRQSTVCDIASNNGITVGSVETVVHEHLFFKEVYVPTRSQRY
jgi:hypothetical protein